MKNFDRQRQLILIVAAIWMFSNFMPRVHTFMLSVSGANSIWWISFFLFALCLVSVFFDWTKIIEDKSVKIDHKMLYFAKISSIVCFAYILLKIIEVMGKTGWESIFWVSLWFGIYVALGASIAMFIVSFELYTKKQFIEFKTNTIKQFNKFSEIVKDKMKKQDKENWKDKKDEEKKN